MGDAVIATGLSPDETKLIGSMQQRLARKRRAYKTATQYYDGTHHVEQMGLAVPEELRGFEYMFHWPAVTVDAVGDRLDIKSILHAGGTVNLHGNRDGRGDLLAEGWVANSMDAQAPLVHSEALVHEAAFVSVSTNAEDEDHPLIVAESTENIIARVDPVTRRIVAAWRMYGDPWEHGKALQGTLYRPDETVWVEKNRQGRWQVANRDQHGLGVVPMVMMLNRRRAGHWEGTSEMAPVIGPVDMAARAIMNLQFGLETLAFPKRFALGVMLKDFVGPDGKPKSTLQAYMDAFFSHPNKDVKIGQLDAADLTNFIDTVNMLSQQVSAATGLPARYFGQNPANPASEGAINADEGRLVKNCERKASDWAVAWSWVLALYERFATGEWPAPHSISVEFHNPATPTFSERADGIQKLNGSIPVLSRQGSWDELGWPEPKKAREREYFRQESEDPYLGLLLEKDRSARGEGGPDEPVSDGAA
jgi:hypothetical protein